MTRLPGHTAVRAEHKTGTGLNICPSLSRMQSGHKSTGEVGPMYKNLIVCAVFVCAAAAAVSQTPVACSDISVGANGALNGFVPSPNDAWHQDITNAPIDPSSVSYTHLRAHETGRIS